MSKAPPAKNKQNMGLDAKKGRSLNFRLLNRLRYVLCMIDEIAFKSVAYHRSLQLRDRVLRKPLGRSLSREDLSGEDQQHHIGYFSGDDLLGVLVLKPLSPSGLKLRQMAVAADARGLGIGRALVTFAEAWAVEHGYQTIAADARQGAVPFYERLRYQVSGWPFHVLGIPHYKVSKHL